MSTFREPDQAAKTISDLNSGRGENFWAILNEWIQEQIEQTNEKINSVVMTALEANEYKIMNEIFKNRIQDLKDLQAAPDKIIMELQREGGEEKENFFDKHDPYPKATDFLPEE